MWLHEADFCKKVTRAAVLVRARGKVNRRHFKVVSGNVNIVYGHNLNQVKRRRKVMAYKTERKENKR